MAAHRNSSQRPNIARSPSGESPVVHPLLNPTMTPSSAALDSAKYVPYTPRQRLAATAPTTQALAISPQGSSKPQLANLRTVAQSIGLEANSVGWAILDKIAYEGDTSDEWSEIWHMLTKARATLLLPSEPDSAHDVITPDFVQDHLVLCDLGSRDNTAVITLSGLRGQLVDDTLTFRSGLHRSTKPFQSLLSPSVSPAASLHALPPLPAFPLESSYPSFTVSAFSATLPLPSRATKPPLPPRPGVRGTSTSSPARLSMSVVAFFQRPSTPPPPLPTSTVATMTPSTDVDSTIDISAFVVDTVLSRTDIAAGIISALNGEIAIALNDQPPWLVERVHAFSLPHFPFVKVLSGKKKLQDIGGNPNRIVYAVNGAFDKPDELADKFQAFYKAVEAELRNGGQGRQMQGDGLDASTPGDPELVAEKDESDGAHIRGILETVESTLCTLLYDRLFLPSSSDDASHNEALSSRIAALNMLDLCLEHLDIDIGDANPAKVDAVVRDCGQTLAQLDATARSPREKAAVLVSAHRLVVDGLSTIPPIRLKSRDDVNKDSSSPRPFDSTDSAEQADTSPVASISRLEPVEIPTSSVPTVHLSISPDGPPPSSETAPSPTSSPVSGDVLLPFLIFSVVKANPRRLVSHLLFTQRLRNQSFGGEESYCLINLMAVAEFLENVDLGALGLGDSERKVLSAADLTPIPIARPSLPESPVAPALSSEDQLTSLRGRVEQGVDAITGSANKVISGVFDTSFGVLRAFLPGQTVQTGTSSRHRNGSGTGAAQRSGVSGTVTTVAAATGVNETDAAPWGGVRPGLGLLRRETGFSIAGLTAALPGGANKAKTQSHTEEEGQRELVEVSHRDGHHDEESEAAEGSSQEGENAQESEGDDEGAGEGREDEAEGEGGSKEEEIHDTRSIRSFESMLSSGRTKRKTDGVTSPVTAATAFARRKRLTELTDRLTHGMTGMPRRVQGGDRSTASTWRLPPPNRRFVECTAQDIRVSEVGELLREYQRLVEAVRSAGGFQE